MADELAEIFKKTNKENPAPADVDRLKQYLTEHPLAAARLGNLANQVQLQLVEKFKHSFVQRVTLEDYCYKLRADLGQKDTPTLEKNLIDHLVLCWMRMHLCELEYEQHTKGVSLPMAEYWEKKLSATQKRYLRALEALARIRKLGVNVQINIADKQIVNP